MTGLFGPSADEVRLAIEQQGQQQDMQWGQLEPGRGPTVLAAQAGRMIGNVAEGLGGYQDPRIQKAQLMQEAAQEVDAQGYSLMGDGSQEYYKAAYSALMKRGLTAEAAHVRDLALNEQATQSKMGLESAQTDAALAKAASYAGKGQQIGKGGLLLPDGTIVPPVSTKSEEPNSDLGKLRSDLDAGRITQKEYEDRYAKMVHIAPPPQNNVTLNNFAEKEGIRDINKQIDASGKAAENARGAVKSIDSALSLLQTSKFKTGILADTRKSIGDTFGFLGYQEAAQAWKMDGADAASLNASLKGVVADLASSLDQGSDRTSAKEIELAMSQVGGTGVPEDGLYTILNIAKKQKQAELDQYDYSLKAALEASKEAGGDADVKNLIFRQKVNDWKNSRPPIITPKEVEEIKRSARLMREAKDVKPVEYYTGTNSSKLKVGMRVTDEGFLRRVKGLKTYKKGTYTVDGIKYSFDRDTVVPELEAVK